MERLTKKNKGYCNYTQFGDKYIPNHNIKHKQCVNKLGELEDIEERLGIDLNTLFKALKNGVYVYNYDKEIALETDFQLLYLNCHGWCLLKSTYILKVSNYGKSWALTKDELKVK